ncbi:MAG: RNA polymerase sigma factor [Clostridiales bacterium]|nr:RNA polymerase sigma factor [Clostridiales bacterium]
MISASNLRTGAQLFEQYYAAMIKRARRYVSDVYDAEDIVSDCWVALLLRMEQLIPMKEPVRTAYIMTSVENASIDFLRKRKRRQRIVEEMEISDADAEYLQELDSLEYQDLLATLLKQLPPYEAKVVEYKLMKYTSSEIAEKLSVSSASVRVYWMRAKGRLQKYIQVFGLLES